MTPYRPIYDYWFAGDLPNNKLWFGKSKKVDEEIRERFGMLMSAEHLEVWTRNPRGWVSLILLRDQFPRNAFRGTPRMFAYDARALACTKRALAEGLLEKLNIFESLFVLLPLEHSEVLADQEECVKRMIALAEGASPEHKKFAEGLVDYALRHHEVITRFGRFPHRNKVLGRKNTAEETKFLKLPGSKF